MKRVLLLTTIGVMFCVALSQAQNVFDPNDPIIRYNSTATLGTPQKPDPGISGLQKWVSTASSGVSSGNGRFDASSFKAYFINYRGNPMPFRIKFPRSYTNPDSAGKTYPAMLFMHGAGEPGCPSNGGLYQNERQLLHGGNLFRQRVDNNEFDGFLIYPQVYVGSANCWSDWGTPGGSPPSNGHFDAIFAMVDSMFRHARLDRERVILTGLSNGGAADWNMTAFYPQWVAKNAPSAAATGATNYTDFVHIPIWFSSGGRDTNPNPGFSNGTYTSIQNAGGDIQFTLFPDLGHSVWYQHWQLPGFVEWMNDLHKANPLIYFGRDEFCPSETIDARLGISPGFYQYEWQKDGVTIATATATAITPADPFENVGNINYVRPVQKYTNYNFTGVNNTVIASITANTITVRQQGTYRVRFKRKNTDQFTVWSPKPAVIGLKSLTQTPPIEVNLTEGLRSKVLPAPDGSTTVPLQLPTGFIGYEWYRNDVLVDTGRLFDAIPGVYKAKVHEQFGCGSIFSPTFNVVAANGEPKPDPATNLTATIENLINIRLNWNQNPNAGTNETGFEIYKSTGGSGGPYKLLAVTAPDVSTYLDADQASNANYYYIVRAVGDFGAAAITNEATAHTPADNVAPIAPANLVAACVTREKVTLNWTASTDNVGVAVYDIYINGQKSYSTPNTRFEIYQLTPLTQYAFTVKAQDAAGNISQPSNQVAAYTRQQGVCYKVFAGDWDDLPDFNTMVPVKEGMSPNIDLSVRPAGLDDRFGFLWEGHATRTLGSSTHQFQICSDDGSRLYWNSYYNPQSNGTINNDGLHGDQCAQSGNISLSSNTPYPFALAFFEKTGGEAMRLNWRTSGSFAAIPNAAFNVGSTPGGAPNAPSGLTATAVSSSQINLGWTDNSNNETGFEVVRATAAAGPFLPVATVTGNSYQDTGLTASTQYWYQVRSVNVAGQSAFTATQTATTQAPPPPPAAPTNLVASTPALQTVQLQWNDNSNNETAFEVWRSVGNNTTFTLLATVPGGAGAQKTYVDAPVFANVHYFYKVRAVGAPTPSGYTNEANASTANSAPVINTVPDFTVRQGGSVTIPITATDVDSDPLAFTVPGLPYFATIQNVSNGNANLVVSPPEGEQGGFTLRAIVDDGFGGKDTARFTIVVNDNSLPVLNPIADVSINEGDSVNVALTATDAEMNQYMVWTFENKPSWITFTNNGNGSGSLKLKPGYSASGIYNMTVIVDDGFGAWTSRSFNIVVNETDPNETIQVNMRYFTGFQALWNDVPLFGVSTFNVNNLINKKNQNSGAGIRYLAGGGPITASDAGMQPGGTGVFPDAIMKDVLQIGHNGGTRSGQIQIYGLDPNKRYNLIFFASINTQVAAMDPWRGYDANTRTIYTVTGYAPAEVRVLGNTNNTDTIYQVQPNASGQITFTMAGNPEDPGVGALLNAMVIDAQFDDGTTPAKPANIQAQVIPNLGVRLTWNDISYNENSYRIFRATDRNGPYTILSPDALKDSVNYLDPNVAPYTQYFYFVRGVNHLGMGASSDTAAAVTGNNKPEISGLDNMFVKTGNSVQDDFTVSDNPSDVITVTILNKPSFVTLTPQGGNTYRITANPTIDHVGFHFLTVQATDNNGGLVTQQVTLNVSDVNTRSVYINFAYNVPAPAPWNNIMGYGNVGTTLNNLRDEQDVVTPFGINLMDGWDGVTEWGHRTGNNSGVFPDSVLAGGLFDLGTTDVRLRFTGLNPAMRYNIVLVGSQNDGLVTTTRYWVTGGPADTLNARNNTNATANLNGLTPSAGGEIIVNITKLTGTYTFLNGVQIEEFAPAITMMAPNNLYVEGRTDRTSAALIWSDRASNEIRYEVQRATDEAFTQNVNSTLLPPGSASLVNSGVAQGLSSNTKYWYRVRAQFLGTNVFSAWSNKKSFITPHSIVYVNFNFSVENGPSPWNNTEALPNFPGTWSGLLNQSNQPSGMTMAIEKIFNGEYAFGIRTGNNSGVVPDDVMQASYWIDRSQIATVRLTGLNQSRRYRIGFTGGIDNSLFSGDMTMTYTVNGRTVYLNTMNNTTKMVWIGDLQPDANGELLIQFSTPARLSVVYGFTSAIIVQSYEDAIGGTQTNSVNPALVDPDVVLQTPGLRIEEVAAERANGMETRMYPNPFVDQINLEFNNTSSANHIAVDVYDMTGRVVYRRNFGSIPAGASTLRLNTAEGKLNTGVYMVTLRVNGLPVQSTKMIKDRK
jgi:large repetitive protein